ncbi:hypothetical protein EYR36_010114 [Pleurotus pulmonarius]|nr:hypothetical protein EYR36_010114 [Pleurotus pulmonarius]
MRHITRHAASSFPTTTISPIPPHPRTHNGPKSPTEHANGARRQPGGRAANVSGPAPPSYLADPAHHLHPSPPPPHAPPTPICVPRGPPTPSTPPAPPPTLSTPPAPPPTLSTPPAPPNVVDAPRAPPNAAPLPLLSPVAPQRRPTPLAVPNGPPTPSTPPQRRRRAPNASRTPPTSSTAPTPRPRPRFRRRRRPYTHPTPSFSTTAAPPQPTPSFSTTTAPTRTLSTTAPPTPTPRPRSRRRRPPRAPSRRRRPPRAPHALVFDDNGPPSPHALLLDDNGAPPPHCVPHGPPTPLTPPCVPCGPPTPLTSPQHPPMPSTPPQRRPASPRGPPTPSTLPHRPLRPPRLTYAIDAAPLPVDATPLPICVPREPPTARRRRPTAPRGPPTLSTPPCNPRWTPSMPTTAHCCLLPPPHTAPTSLACRHPRTPVNALTHIHRPTIQSPSLLPHASMTPRAKPMSTRSATKAQQQELVVEIPVPKKQTKSKKKKITTSADRDAADEEANETTVEHLTATARTLQESGAPLAPPARRVGTGVTLAPITPSIITSRIRREESDDVPQIASKDKGKGRDLTNLGSSDAEEEIDEGEDDEEKKSDDEEEKDLDVDLGDEEDAVSSIAPSASISVAGTSTTPVSSLITAFPNDPLLLRIATRMEVPLHMTNSGKGNGGLVNMYARYQLAVGAMAKWNRLTTPWDGAPVEEALLRSIFIKRTNFGTYGALFKRCLKFPMLMDMLQNPDYNFASEAHTKVWGGREVGRMTLGKVLDELEAELAAEEARVVAEKAKKARDAKKKSAAKKATK